MPAIDEARDPVEIDDVGGRQLADGFAAILAAVVAEQLADRGIVVDTSQTPAQRGIGAGHE